MMLNVQRRGDRLHFPLPLYHQRAVVVLLLLVLYYSALGVAVTMYDNAHRTITGDTTVVPVLHMPNINSTCRMAWCLCCCACSTRAMDATSQLR